MNHESGPGAEARTELPAIVRDTTPSTLGTLSAALMFLALALALQIVRGSYHDEFNGSPDEPAHFVTGLMVRDYVANGLPGSPMAFARDYYLHYPKVAFGQWPPILYVVQA